MSKRELCHRYLVFFLGVCFAGFGISLITKSGLGTSAVSSLAYVMTFVTPLTLGMTTLLVNSACLLGQVFIQRADFPRIQLLQLPATIVFGLVIDLCMYLLTPLVPRVYPMRVAALLAGCIFLGLGVALEVLADVLMLPGEGIVRVVSQKLGREFGGVKTLFDILMVVSAGLLSILCLGRIAGIREGTLIAALTVGAISRFFRIRLGHILPWKRERPEQAVLLDEPKAAAESA